MTSLARRLARSWLLPFCDPRRLAAAARLPRFFLELHHYRRIAGGTPVRLSDAMPCLEDQVGNTPFDAHYFHQGAWLARRLAAAGPALHVDVGSSVMMLSVLSAHVRLLFVDYRPLRARLPGLSCIAGSALQLPFADASLESVSSLHVIEHVGLGRYGDAVNPAGSELALAELARVMRPGGKLYLSVPVGRERTCFNAHRVFSPSTIAGCLSQLVPISFSLVDDDGAWNNEVPGSMETSLDHIEYGCGMFEFTRGHD